MDLHLSYTNPSIWCQCILRNITKFWLAIRRNGVLQHLLHSLWPGDAIWHYKSWLILFQVIVCFVLNCYLNQYWLIENYIKNKLHWNISSNTTVIIPKNALENVTCIMVATTLCLLVALERQSIENNQWMAEHTYMSDWANTIPDILYLANSIHLYHMG